MASLESKHSQISALPELFFFSCGVWRPVVAPPCESRLQTLRLVLQSVVSLSHSGWKAKVLIVGLAGGAVKPGEHPGGPAGDGRTPAITRRLVKDLLYNPSHSPTKSLQHGRPSQNASESRAATAERVGRRSASCRI